MIRVSWPLFVVRKECIFYEPTRQFKIAYKLPPVYMVGIFSYFFHYLFSISTLLYFSMEASFPTAEILTDYMFLQHKLTRNTRTHATHRIRTVDVCENRFRMDPRLQVLDSGKGDKTFVILRYDDGANFTLCLATVLAAVRDPWTSCWCI